MKKSQIENIKVDHEQHRSSVGWQIGTNRFHVWIDTETKEPEDTIYKNPIAARDEPGHYDTRRLYRDSSKAAAAMFNEVWTIVKRDDLLTKAKQEAELHYAKLRHIDKLKTELKQIEQEVMSAWKAGNFNASAAAAAFHQRYTKLTADLETV